MSPSTERWPTPRWTPSCSPEPGTGHSLLGGDLASGFVDEPIALHEGRRAFADLLRSMRRGGKPTIARVNGHALAGGFGLATACDITICVDRARLGVGEVKVGLWPMMISAVLLEVLPVKAARELMLTGRSITPDEALAMGAVSRVVSFVELDEAVDEVVDAIVSLSRATIQLGRDSLFGVADLGFDAALDRLHAGLTAVALTADSREGVAAFVEKRTPRWSGR